MPFVGKRNKKRDNVVLAAPLTYFSTAVRGQLSSINCSNPATVDYLGRKKTLHDNESAHFGARAEDNLLAGICSSNDINDGKWSAVNSATIIDQTTFTTGDTTSYIRVPQLGQPLAAGESIVVRTKIRTDSETAGIRYKMTESDGSTTAGSYVVIGTTKKIFSQELTAVGDGIDLWIWIQCDTSGVTITVEDIAVHNTTGETDTSLPPEFISANVGLGSELVSNGTFDSNIDGFSANDAEAVVSWDSGTIKVFNSDASVSEARTTINTVVGHQYIFKVDYIKDIAGGVVRLGSSAGINDVMDSGNISETQTYVAIFTATSSVTHISLKTNSPTINLYTNWDNLSVKTLSHNVGGNGIKCFSTTKKHINVNSKSEVSYTDFNHLEVHCWGDSMIGQGSPNTLYSMAEDYFDTAYNGGVGGETSTQVKARFDADSNKSTRAQIIWAGRNNYGDPNQVIADIEAMIADIPHNNFIIVSVFNGDYGGYDIPGGPGYINMTTINDYFNTNYPQHYADARTEVVNSYDPLQAQDVIDFNNDTPPASLRVDQLHLTSAGSLIANNKILEVQQSLVNYQTQIDEGDLKGLQCAPGSTNKCTNYNLNPDSALTLIGVESGTGTLSRVIDNTNLSADLDGELDLACNSGYVFKYVASADSVILFYGSCNNTNIHTGSIYAKISGGNGELRLATIKLADITSPTYKRVWGTSNPLSSVNILKLFVPAGETAHFVGNQLEELPFATYPIETLGDTGSRGPMVYAYDWFSGFVNRFGLKLKFFYQGYNDDVSSYIFGIGTATDRLEAFISASTQKLALVARVDNVAYVIQSDAALVVGQTYVFEPIYKNGLSMKIDNVMQSDTDSISDDFGWGDTEIFYVGGNYQGVNNQFCCIEGLVAQIL